MAGTQGLNLQHRAHAHTHTRTHTHTHTCTHVKSIVLMNTTGVKPSAQRDFYTCFVELWFKKILVEYQCGGGGGGD